MLRDLKYHNGMHIAVFHILVETRRACAMPGLTLINRLHYDEDRLDLISVINFHNRIVVNPLVRRY